MTRLAWVSGVVIGVVLMVGGGKVRAQEATADVGDPPIITSPAENEWFALNAPVDYCWLLPEGVTPEAVSGYELQFSNTQTPDGPWDAVRFFTATCWHYAAGHQCIWEALYWRVRIVYDSGDRSPWAISYHRVGTAVATESSSWGRIKNLYE